MELRLSPWAGFRKATAHEARISLDSAFGVGTRVVSFSTLSKTDLGRRKMKRELVLGNGDKHPWVREAYYGMRRYGANVTVSSRVSYAGATYCRLHERLVLDRGHRHS